MVRRSSNELARFYPDLAADLYRPLTPEENAALEAQTRAYEEQRRTNSVNSSWLNPVFDFLREVSKPGGGSYGNQIRFPKR
jgi:hypothetical protein